MCEVFIILSSLNVLGLELFNLAYIRCLQPYGLKASLSNFADSRLDGKLTLFQRLQKVGDSDRLFSSILSHSSLSLSRHVYLFLSPSFLLCE